MKSVLQLRGFCLSLLCMLGAFLGHGQSWTFVGNAESQISLPMWGKEYGVYEVDGSGTPYYAVYANNQLTVHRFNGSNWEAVGGAVLSGYLYGDVILEFDANDAPYLAYSTPSNTYVKKWDGTDWQTLGNLPASNVNSLSMIINGAGNPIVAFSDLSDNLTVYVRNWNGSSWDTVGNAPISGAETHTTSMIQDNTGNILVALNDSYLGYDLVVKRWDGSSWQVIHSNILSGNSWARRMTFDNAGRLILATLGADPWTMNHMVFVVRYDGNSWSNLGTLATGDNGNFSKLVVDDQDNYYIAGTSYTTQSRPFKWDGNSWTPLLNGLAQGGNSTNIWLVKDQSDEIIVCQTFGPGLPAIQRWDGDAWISAITEPVNGQDYAEVFAISGDTNGHPVVAYSGMITPLTIKQWNGTIWNTLCVIPGHMGYDIAVDPLGRTVALILDHASNPHPTYVIRWNGTTWDTLGGIMESHDFPRAKLQFDASGNPVICLPDASSGEIQIIRWDGSSWAGIAPPYQGTWSNPEFGLDNTGNPLIAATTGTSCQVVKWDGTAWVNVGGAIPGTTYEFRMTIDALGNPVVATSGPNSSLKVWRFDGSNWSDIGTFGSAYNPYLFLDKEDNPVLGYSSYPNTYLKKFDGTNWIDLGDSPAASSTTACFAKMDDRYYLVYANSSMDLAYVKTLVDGSGASITAFGVTGGGFYCAGSSGVNVGLDSSEVDVMYQLLEAGVPVGTPVSGTGSAISFGAQPAGIYTVQAFTSTDTVMMNGSATVVENPTPSFNVAPVSTIICAGASITLNAQGNAASYSWSNGVSNGVAFTPANSDTYVVTATSDSGCVAYDTIHITVNPLPVLPGAFSVSSAVVYSGQTGVVYEVPADTFSYHWSFTSPAVTLNVNGHSLSMDISAAAPAGVDTLKLVAFTNSSPVCSSAVLSMPVTIADVILWIGDVDSSWSNGGNWSGGYEPNAATKIKVPAGTPADPVIATGSKVVRALELEAAATIAIEDGASLGVSEELKVSGTISGEGVVVLNGTSTQQISGNGIVSNLELNNTSGATIAGGDILRIRRSYKPTAGMLMTNGGLELLADADGSASVLEAGCSSAYISGDVITNVFIAGGNRSFRFLGHPFSVTKSIAELTDDIDVTGQNGAANGFTTTGTNNPSAFWFDTPNGNNDAAISTGWVDFNHTNGLGNNAWDKMEAIRVLVRGAKGEGLDGQPYTPSDVTIDMSGEINQCDVTHTLASNNDPVKRGYNLISNPYPSAIEMTQLIREDSVGDAFYVWDPRAGTHGGGAYVVASFDPLINASYVVPSHAGMFLYVKPGSLFQNKITFTESMKVQTASSSTVFKTTAGMSAEGLQLQVLSHNGDVFWDRLYIRFDDQSTPMVDGRDAYKLKNPSLDFYTLSGSNKLSIDVRPMAINTVIPLGFATDSQFQYTIRIADYNVNGPQLYLIDKYLNQSAPLSAGVEYQFDVTGDPQSKGEHRFEIGIGTTAVTTTHATQVQMHLMPNPATERLTVRFEAQQHGLTRLVVRNTLGQQVYSEALGGVRSGSVTIPVSELAAGVYTLTLSGEGFSETQKFIKQ